MNYFSVERKSWEGREAKLSSLFFSNEIFGIGSIVVLRLIHTSTNTKNEDTLVHTLNK